MPEPVTLAALTISGLTWVAAKAAGKGAEVLGGVAGNVGDRLLVGTLQGTRDRIAGLRGLPEVHDVARSIRIAQMQALERVIRDYRDRTGRRRWFESTTAAAFFDRSLDFCARTVGRCLDRSVVLNFDVTPTLLNSVDGLLAPPAHDGSGSDRAAALARHAEDTVLHELSAVLGDVTIPDAFTEHFRQGNGNRPRFLELFGAYVSEQLKTSDRFRDILFAGQLSTLTGLARSTDESVTRVADQIDTLFRDYRLGDLVVQGRSEAYLTLTRRPGRAKLVNSELRLLDPFTRSIPLIGRDTEVTECLSWLRGDARVSVRGMTGRAGAGKTRLALEVCERIGGEGWDAGFITAVELSRFRGEVNAAQWEWEKPTLIVVDDAAAFAPLLHSWLTELADHTGYDKRPLRLLLLERHADQQTGWWETIVGRGWDADAVRALFDPPGPVTLAPLAAAETRNAVFAAMQDRLGALERVPPLPNRDFAEQLERLSWGGEPLFLMMAALTARQSGVATALALTRTDAARKIAEHELSRIDRLRPSTAANTSHQFVAHLAAYVTLRQGLPLADALAVMEEEQEALRRLGVGDPPDLLAWLKDALPGEHGNIAPILPDIIGEAVVLQALGEGEQQAAVEAVARCAQRAWIPVVTSATRIAQDFAPAWHDPATKLHPAIAWLDLLVVEAFDDQDRLSALLARMPASTLTLRERTLSWTLRLVTLLRADVEAEGGRERFAGALNNLANRLSDVGEREAALAAIEEAVAAYRELAAARPGAFKSELAMLLDQKANRLSDLGQRDAALAASEDALAVFRELAAAHPDAVRHDLARSLHNVSIHRSNLGHRKAALTAIEEAVVIRRELAATRPDTFRPNLAFSLNNLASRLSDLGQREAALAASKEAVAVFRELSAARPDAFRPDLAMSLNDLANGLNDLGQRDAALVAIGEAVVVYRDLAAARPDVFQPDLAMSLNNLAVRLRDLGQLEAALSAIENAEAIYRELAAARPDAFLPDLAGSQINLANLLSDFGQPEAALVAIVESVAVFRELAAASPDTFRPDLATSLDNLSCRLSDLEQREAALAAIEEAVVIRRELAAAHPDAFRPDLAGSLNNLAARLSDNGQWEAALAAIQEAVPVYREMTAAHPDVFRPDLAMSINNLSNRLSYLGHRQAALAAIEEAVVIRRQLAASRPDVFRPDLALSLNNLANRLGDLEHREAALAAIEEAVAMYRELAAARPDAFRPDLAMSLHDLAHQLSALGQRAAALAATEEAVTTLRPQFLRRPKTFAVLMQALAKQYHSAIEQGAGQPNMVLLAPILEAFERIRREPD